MNTFLINLVGHQDQYLAKKQLIKEIFAYSKLPKTVAARKFLWETDITVLSQIHRRVFSHEFMMETA